MPVGIQSFKGLPEKDFVYVNKEAFVFKSARESRLYFLSRPRRFEKSLFLLALQAYFIGQKELFKDLEIEKRKEQIAFPRQTCRKL